MVSSNSQGDGPLSEINVTPFVDVMLVLLVIFMIAAPLIHQRVDLDLPETQSKDSATIAENDVVLEIDKKQRITVEENEIPLKTLTPKLREIFKSKKKKEIFLRADKRLPYGFVVKVMALVKNAGINRMGMITEAESRK